MDFLEKILTEKAAEVAAMPLETPQEMPVRPRLYDYLQAHPETMQLIAEIKRASPSKGTINSEVDIIAQAKAYEAGGAAAISVLTDPVFFKGTIADLQQVAAEVELPLLCKDFIIHRKQLIRAKNAGASIVLLIVAALSEEQLEELYQEATQLGLEVLVETHDQEELAIAQRLGAKLIGVNNRDLTSFEVTIATSVKLAPTSEEAIFISESGFRTREDVAQVTENYQAVLVGETLMRSGSIPEKIKELQVSRHD